MERIVSGHCQEPVALGTVAAVWLLVFWARGGAGQAPANPPAQQASFGDGEMF